MDRKSIDRRAHSQRGGRIHRVSALAGALLLALVADVNAADRAWRNPDGGTFSIASNWFGGVPGASDVAGFGLSTPGILGALPLYTVSFTADATNQALRMLDDRMTFDLNGHV